MNNIRMVQMISHKSQELWSSCRPVSATRQPSRAKLSSAGNVFRTRYFCTRIPTNYWESVVGSVIQATGTVEFEDGLRTGVFRRIAGAPLVAALPWSLI